MAAFLICVLWYLVGFVLILSSCYVQNWFHGRVDPFYLSKKDKAAIPLLAFAGPWCLAGILTVLFIEATRNDD